MTRTEDDELLELARLAGLQEGEPTRPGPVETWFFGGMIAVLGLLAGITGLNILGGLM